MKPDRSPGRPTRGPQKRKSLSLRLPPSAIEEIKALGGGSFTGGVEYLLQRYKQQG